MSKKRKGGKGGYKRTMTFRFALATLLAFTMHMCVPVASLQAQTLSRAYGSGGGGGGFALGVTGQTAFTGTSRAVAEAARDSYFASNPSQLSQYNTRNSGTDDPLHIVLSYLDGGDTVGQVQARNTATPVVWEDRRAAIGIQGIPGINGGIMSFESEMVLATAMTVQANRDLLKTGLPVEVNVGNDVVVGLTWRGVDQPNATQYNRALFVPYTARFASGSVGFGETIIASALGGTMSVTDMQRNERFAVVTSQLTTSGNIRPTHPGFGAVSVLSDSLSNNATLGTSQSVYEFTSPASGGSVSTTAESLTLDFAVAPAAMRYEAWVGTDTTGLKVIDKFVSIGGTSQQTVSLNSESAIIPTNGYFNRLTGTSAYQLRGNVDGGDFIPALRLQGRTSAPVGMLMQTDTGTDTGDLVTLEDVSGTPGLPAVDGSRLTGITSESSTRKYSETQYRRQDFTLAYTGSVSQPGAYIRVENATTITVPASTADSQLGSHWGIQNASPGETVTLQVATPAGHTIVIEGFSRPVDIPSGVSLDIVLVDRTASTSNYRIMNWSQGIEGLMAVTPITGTSVNIFGIAGRPVHYRIDTSGSANFDVTIMGLGLLPVGESCRALIENVNATHGLNLRVPTGTTFRDTITSIIAIEPGNAQWVTITNNAGTLEVLPDGPIEYTMVLTSHDILNTGDNKGDWTGIPAFLSDVISSPTLLATRDQLTAEPGAGFMLQFDFAADFDFGGTTQAGTYMTVSVTGDRNDSGGGVEGDTVTRSVERRNVAQSTIARTWVTSLPSGNYFNLLLTGFPASGATSVRMINPVAIVTITMKR